MLERDLPRESPMPRTKADTAPFGKYAPTGLARVAGQAASRCSTGWFARRAAFFLRSLALRSLRGRPIDVTPFGARMRLYPQRNVAEKRLAFTPQYFDPRERKLLASKLSGDFVFLDLGASVGGYALFMAALGGAGAKILAVEPLPEVFERLIFNIRQSHFANIKAVGCAVVDIDGEVTLFVNKNNQGETSTRIVSAEAVVEQIRVPAKSLLTLVRDEGYDRLDAIKLDIEGAEDLALEPYLRDAPRSLWPRLIIMEFTLLVSAQVLEMHLRELGYREILRTGENVAYEISPES